jgi:hypothetical protein
VSPIPPIAALLRDPLVRAAYAWLPDALRPPLKKWGAVAKARCTAAAVHQAHGVHKYCSLGCFTALLDSACFRFSSVNSNQHSKSYQAAHVHRLPCTYVTQFTDLWQYRRCAGLFDGPRWHSCGISVCSARGARLAAAGQSGRRSCVVFGPGTGRSAAHNQ